jgi:hypothetical protein
MNSAAEKYLYEIGNHVTLLGLPSLFDDLMILDASDKQLRNLKLLCFRGSLF